MGRAILLDTAPVSTSIDNDVIDIDEDDGIDVIPSEQADDPIRLFASDPPGGDTFHDIGIGTTPGEQFKKVWVHLVYACKHEGLRSSGKRWSEKFLSACLRDMRFFASLADPCIRMRRVLDDYYEYIAAYVDDIALASKDPAGIIRALTANYKCKLKGTEPCLVRQWTSETLSCSVRRGVTRFPCCVTRFP